MLIKNSYFCNIYCKGKKIIIPEKGKLKEEDLVICEEGNRKVYFSIIGNNSENPKIAIVGLSPGYSQLRTLIQLYNSGEEFKKAAELSSFKKCSKNLTKLLRYYGIDKYLGIDIPDNFDFNKNKEFFLTTSLVKCCSLKNTKGRSNAFDILKFNCTRLCFINVFLNEILDKKYKNLKKIIILGKNAEIAIKEKLINDKSVEDILKENKIDVIFILHPSTQNTGRINKLLAGKQKGIGNNRYWTKR